MTSSLSKMDRGFPRRSMNITPEECLYDPTRIFGGRDRKCSILPTGQMVLLQPRMEAPLSRESCRSVRQIAPRTDIPFARKPYHIGLPRDAEQFSLRLCTSLPPRIMGFVGVPPVWTVGTSVAIWGRFETPANARTIFRNVTLVPKDGIPYGIRGGLIFRSASGAVPLGVTVWALFPTPPGVSPESRQEKVVITRPMGTVGVGPGVATEDPWRTPALRTDSVLYRPPPTPSS